MKITLLGTGSFVSDLEHMGPGYLLETGGKKILVDAGCGVQIQLLKLGIGIADLDYIFITHFHADHTCDLYSMLMRRFMLGAFYGKDLNPLYICGPKGMAKFVRDIGRVHQLDYFDNFKKLIYKELGNMEEWALDGFSVRAFEVDHIDSDCVAYRFEVDGKTVVFSGDTTKCEGILNATKGADILIADTSLSKEMKGPHLNTLDIGEISEKGNVKKVILSHLLPHSYDKDLVAEVKENFDGEVILGKDLMEIRV